MDGGPRASTDASDLAALRRRAYGPDADIWGDDDAQHRLRELEQQERPSDRAVAGGEPAWLSGSVPEPSPPTLSQGPPEIDAPTDAVLAPRARRLWLVALASLVLGGIAGGALVSASVPRANLVLETTNDRLPEELSRQIMDWGVGESGIQGHEPLGELTAWTAMSATGESCMILVARSSIQAVACAPGGLDPSVDVVVGRDVPVPGPEIPDGSALRLLADDDGVAVWVKQARPSVEPTSPSDEQT
ncbi:hypothetical protein [Microbacterium sp. R86528]|uniref:hypothetical protein n=1 Tax=Microbacterium sp. R86528 TaxID=3093864 RepID=UPI0037C55D08